MVIRLFKQGFWAIQTIVAMDMVRFARTRGAFPHPIEGQTGVPDPISVSGTDEAERIGPLGVPAGRSDLRTDVPIHPSPINGAAIDRVVEEPVRA